MEKNPGIDFPLLKKVDEGMASFAEYASINGTKHEQISGWEM